jgi:diphosphomevalonate decarboxylase
MMSVTAKAPINIALIKYWGKKDTVNVLPYNPSISLSLNVFYSITSIKRSDTKSISFSLNGIPNESMKKRIIPFLKHFTNGKSPEYINIESTNTGPTAAGLASSASGFAALAVAANHYYKTNYSLDELAKITKLGSGSAIRSLLGGCVMWNTDGSIESLQWPFLDTCMAIVVIDDQKKSIGSTEAMQRSVNTSPGYHQWVEQSFMDIIKFQEALKQNDFQSIGLITEANALAMHELCNQSVPPINYLTLESKRLISAIQESRYNGIFDVYVTMDAGPNIKAIMREKDREIFEKWLTKHGFPKPIWSSIDQKGAVLLEA